MEEKNLESWKIWYFGEKRNLKFENNFEIWKLIWKFGKRFGNMWKFEKNENLKKKLEIIRKYGKIWNLPT